jgi:hypothetical protein
MRRKRFMQNPKTERRLISGALWFVTACVILAILTSCSAYTVNPTQTETPSTTARQLSQLATNQPPLLHSDRLHVEHAKRCGHVL